MGPLLWWWRWWLGDDPNRDQRLTEARDLLDEQRSQAEELDGRLREREREVEELRGRTTTLEQHRTESEHARTALTAELDRARAQADEVRARLTAELDHARAETEEVRGQLTAELDQARTEADELRARVATLEAPADTEAGGGTDTEAGADVEAGREILGAKLAEDDLTVVEGVGPKIAGLLSDAGIDTWAALAEADVERLRLVLAEAGPRYRMHDPSSWPTQGRLLAAGRWQDFKDLTTS